FDLRDVLVPLNSKSAEEITVTRCPTNIECAKRYIIQGKVQNVGFRRWIRKKALEADLYGHAKNLKNGDLEVMVAGLTEDVKNFKQICETGPQKSSVTLVDEKDWTKPIKVGFEIKKTPKLKKKANDTTQKKQQKLSFFQRVINKIK